MELETTSLEAQTARNLELECGSYGRFNIMDNLVILHETKIVSHDIWRIQNNKPTLQTSEF